MTRPDELCPIDQSGISLPADSVAELTAEAFHERLVRREISVLEYIRALADRVDRIDGLIGAFEYFDRGMTEDAALDMDWQITNGRTIGSQTGVPIGVKDIINVDGYPSSRGSPILADYVPGNDARIVSSARLDGAIVFGKTVTAEFGIHHPGKTGNPHDPSRSAGTSSSGSAAAVAARMVPAAMSTQTAASTVRPASYCGIFCFKPSFGTVPRTGVLKTTDTLDSMAFMARCVADVSSLFEVCRVRGKNYPVIEEQLANHKTVGRRDRPWRIGIVQGPRSDREASDAKAALSAWLKHLDVPELELVEFVLPSAFDEAHTVHSTIYNRSVAYYFKEDRELHSELMSKSIAEMMELGTRISTEEFFRALERQDELAALLEHELKSRNVDILLGLSAAGEAPIGRETRDEEDHSLIWTMCGNPAVSIPALSGENKMPIGVQLVARKYGDYPLLEFAQELSNLLNIKA